MLTKQKKLLKIGLAFLLFKQQCYHLTSRKQNLFVDGEQIVLKDTKKDLVVCCNFEMSWITNHITRRLKKANMQFNYIRKSSPISLSSSIRISLFKSCVLLIIFYASPVWFRTKNQSKRID